MRIAQTVRHRLVGLSAATVMALSLVACGSPAPEAGIWQMQDGTTLGPDATEIPIEVKRAACSNGQTGKVLNPVVVYEADRIVISARVEGRRSTDATCPDNNAVPIVVELTEPIGDRELVDGECLDEARRNLPYCTTEVRWPVPADFEGI